MRRIASFLALTAPEKALLLQAFFWLPVTVLALRVRGLRPLPAPAKREPAVAPARIAELVAIAARHGLARGNCLSQSLTLRRLLGGGELRIGARRGACGLEAHAWVEHAGRPLNEAPGVAERFPPFPALPVALSRLV